MEGDSSMLGEEDSDERMVNELVIDGCGDAVSDGDMVIDDVLDPIREVEGLKDGAALMEEDQEGPAVPLDVIVEEG